MSVAAYFWPKLREQLFFTDFNLTPCRTDLNKKVRNWNKAASLSSELSSSSLLELLLSSSSSSSLLLLLPFSWQQFYFYFGLSGPCQREFFIDANGILLVPWKLAEALIRRIESTSKHSRRLEHRSSNNLMLSPRISLRYREKAWQC